MNSQERIVSRDVIFFVSGCRAGGMGSGSGSSVVVFFIFSFIGFNGLFRLPWRMFINKIMMIFLPLMHQL